MKCEVCGKIAPIGHKICDECWPARAIEVGRAAYCTLCGKPRLIEKLVLSGDNKLVCQTTP